MTKVAMTQALQWKVSDLPEGSRGDWAIKRETVSAHEAAFAAIRAISSGRGRGNYEANEVVTILRHRGCIVMSDTRDEWRDHKYAVFRAKGHVLAHGLGIGMFVNAVLQRPEVERVLVVEESADVIALVAPHYRAKYGSRFEVIQGDAYTWTPPKGARWDLVWHDIWDEISADNLPGMRKLHRRFGRRCEEQYSWCRERIERMYR